MAGDTGIGVIMPCYGEDSEAQAASYKNNAVESALHQSPEAVPVVFAPQKEYEAYLQWKSMSGNSFNLLAKAAALITTLQETAATSLLESDCTELLDEISDVVGELPIVNEVCEATKKKKKTKVTKEPVPAAAPPDAEGEDYMDYE